MAGLNQMNQGYVVGAPPQFYPNNNLLMNTPYDNYMGRVTNQQQNLANQFLKCRPVSSKEEAQAAQIDLDGSLWVFTDVGNAKIYTKQINTDGTATFNTYVLTKEEQHNELSSQFVTKTEFNNVIQSLMAAIQSNRSQELEPANNQSSKNTLVF